MVDVVAGCAGAFEGLVKLADGRIDGLLGQVGEVVVRGLGGGLDHRLGGLERHFPVYTLIGGRCSRGILRL